MFLLSGTGSAPVTTIHMANTSLEHSRGGASCRGGIAYTKEQGEFMAEERCLPDNPLAFIGRCVTERKIYWTYHVNMRLERRYIPRRAVLASVEQYEIIEAYPDDKYFPSYLVYSLYRNEVFHVLFGVDVGNDNVRVITAPPGKSGTKKVDGSVHFLRLSNFLIVLSKIFRESDYDPIRTNGNRT
uniref:Uncharacterized protein n=1 Tax=Candidatus Kentrum sp. TC TaxID=2126339 RepID=A0A450ZRP1_9GAMM|nr:MAG: protein of unknown function (DUF4258) [Candidatus Kentron sp. TC]